MDHDSDFHTWNVFRRRYDEGLCCAVSAEAPVPPFLLSGEWNFGFAVADGDPPVTGFCPMAAAVGAGFDGFYLFLTIASASAAAAGTPPSSERH